MENLKIWSIIFMCAGMRGSADILIYLDVEKALKGKLFSMPS
jgi:hypothetical protein